MRASSRGAALAWALGLACALAGTSRPAGAFPHVMKPGESLARLAEHTYGLVDHERVLVSANGLDAGNGVAVVRGMRIEVPALDHYRIQAGDTWASLAEALLGHSERQDVLAAANDSSPWQTPAEGAEIVIPYNLRVQIGPGDSLISVAQRFMGAKEKAWVLDRYNFLKGNPVKKGDLLLVPLTNLKLTDEGKAMAMAAGAFERSQGAGSAREAQRRAEAELPSLVGEVRSGRYLDAVHRGIKMLGYGELSRPQLAMLHRQLTEAYVALDARGHASASCRAWREADTSVVLDPTYLSPKILAACEPAYGPAKKGRR
jgi:hypothetical protein